MSKFARCANSVCEVAIKPAKLQRLTSEMWESRDRYAAERICREFIKRIAPVRICERCLYNNECCQRNHLAEVALYRVIKRKQSKRPIVISRYVAYWDCEAFDVSQYINYRIFHSSICSLIADILDAIRLSERQEDCEPVNLRF